MSLLLEDYGVKAVEVPGDFPLELADRLRERGVTVTPRPSPFLPERVVKTAEEVAAIEETQRHTETALEAAIQMLRESVIRGDEVIYRGRPLTSEDLKKTVNVSLMENDCIAEHTIIACGDEGVDPHNQGVGPRPAQPGDHLRHLPALFPDPLLRGHDPDGGQGQGHRRAPTDLRRGARQSAPGHRADPRRRLRLGDPRRGQPDAGVRGYMTGVVNGRNQGFFHGTGHGVGLDIHEMPRISRLDSELKTGHVVTVEPGLYYPGRGAVRIEDMVLVEGSGCRNLTRSPKMELLEL